MAYARRSFAGAAPATTLSSGISNADTTITIVSATGWPTGASGDFFIVVDRGSPSEEKVRCASRSGTSITVQTAGRGADGTAAATHAAGVTVEHVIVAVDADEANYAVSKTVGQATAAGQILVVDGTNSFAAVQGKTSGQLLMGNGTTVVSQAVSGDVTINGSGATAIGTGKVTAGMIGAGGVSATNQIGTGVVTTTNVLDGTLVDADLSGSAGIQLSKLATNPLARANHTGTQTASTVSDFDTQVRTSRLDQMAAPTADVSLNSHKVTGLAAPTAGSTDASTAAYAERFKTRFVTGQPTAGTYGAGPTTILTMTVTDPGYNIDVWGAVTVAASGTLLEYWAVETFVDGSAHHYIIIPFGTTGVNQSFAALIPPVTHTTGTNCTILVKVTRITGSGSFVVPNDGIPNNGFVAYAAH